MKLNRTLPACILALAFLALQRSATDSTEVPEVYKKIYGASRISSDGTYVYIRASGVPDHKSAYFPASNQLYEDYRGTTAGGIRFRRNPSVIAAQNFTFRIPIHPQKAARPRPTNMGPIGVAINGVPFFNQYAGNGQPLSHEIQSFDQWWGHPAPTNEYHYHIEPLYLTTVKANKSALLGFLLDGFPVYGPEEGGKEVTNARLDEFHGHEGKTADYPDGIYHYHITSADPYLNGSGYYGTPGSVSR